MPRLPHLVIVDLDLQAAAGLDLLRMLQQPPAPIPALVVSGVPKDALDASSVAVVERSQGFFQKPLHTRPLMDRVRQLLGLSSEIRAHTPAPGVPVPHTEDLGSLPPPPHSLPAWDAYTPEVTHELEEIHVLSEELTEDLPATADPLRPVPPPLPPDDEEIHPDAGASAPPQTPSMPAAEPALAVPAADAEVAGAWKVRVAQSLVDRPPTVIKPHSGSLEQTRLPALLEAYFAAQQAGQLVLQKGAAQRTLFLNRGWLVGAQSNVVSEQLLWVIQHLGLAPKEKLDQAFQGGTRQASALVSSGVLTVEQLKQALEFHRARILRSAFQLKDGEYTLTLLPPRRTPLKPLFVANVILRGVVEGAALLDLRAALPRDVVMAPRADSIYPLNTLQLSADEARLVIACDGTKTVEDLLTLSDLDEAPLLGLLLGLETLKLVHRVTLEQAHARSRNITFF